MFYPTIFRDLNVLLDDFSQRLQHTLGDNLHALYITGSFALGGADEHSDVDFLAVTKQPVTSADVAALNQMHAALYASAPPWSTHLEGSYFWLDELRQHRSAEPAQSTAPGQPLWFLDNTAQSLAFTDHENTRVVRSVTREHGITLFGPPPTITIDPVSAEDLHAEISTIMQTWGQDIIDGQWRLESRWHISFAVISFCRMLHTLETGRVFSKPASVEWALHNTPRRYHEAIDYALLLRPNPGMQVHARPQSNEIDEALAVIRYALSTQGQL